MSLISSSQTILKILADGFYHSPSGEEIHFQTAQDFTVEHTQLYTPPLINTLRDQLHLKEHTQPTISVLDGTTQVIAQRYAPHWDPSHPPQASSSHFTLLNFASARNPGGGFLNGARAQEEDLCRCSGLYPTLLTQPDYYTINRAQSSMLYTDHMIYSPHVLFLKTKGKGPLLERPFTASVITAPAPNTGPYMRREEGSLLELEEAFLRRWRGVLAVADDQKCTTLLLGAWGCGAFQGDPYMVTRTAAQALSEGTGSVREVIFAIPNKGKRSARNFAVFQEIIGSV